MTPKMIVAVTTGCMVIITAAYLIWLAATWQAYKQDRDIRDGKMNELLDRLPRAAKAAADGEAAQ